MSARADTTVKPSLFGVAEKLSLAIIATLFFSIPLCALLNYLNFEKNYSEMVRSRYAVLARDLGRAAEYGFDLGLSLSHFLKMRELMLRTQANDFQIMHVRAYDPRGLILFDTEAANEGKAVPADWPRAANASPGTDFWHQEESDYYVVGFPLFNPQGVAEGTVSIAYSKTEVLEASQRIGQDLLRKATIVLGGVSLFSLIAVYLFIRGTVTRLRFMNRQLDQLMSGTATASALPTNTDALELAFHQCQPIWTDAGQHIRAMEEEQTQPPGST